jgi:hypothetical protein
VIPAWLVRAGRALFAVWFLVIVGVLLFEPVPNWAAITLAIVGCAVFGLAEVDQWLDRRWDRRRYR